MRNSLIQSAARIGLIAITASSFAIAQDAASKENEAPAMDKEAAAAADAAPASPAAPANPAEAKSDASYALGFRTGGNFAQEFGRFGVTLEDLEMDTFIKGFTTAAKSEKPEIEEARLQAAMTSLGETLQQREKEAAQANLEAGKKFLEENAKREGVVALPSGLQYEVLEKGGEEKYTAPKEGEESNKQFMVNYKGTLIDGTQFDASPEGSPVPMTLQVIEGFKEALTTMPVGAKWKLFIPSELAYGAERRSAEIEPNSTLIFELELVEIKDAPAAPEGAFPMPQPAGQ